MVRVTKEKAQENRAKLVASADRALREKGYDGLSVAAVAKDAGLTEGAVFRNFPNKAALAAEAVEAGFAPTIGLLRGLHGPEGLTAYITAYLGRDHRDHFPWGCPVGALGGEAHRYPEDVKAAYLRGYEALIAEIARFSGSKAAAVRILSALSGAIGLARALRAAGEATESDRVLDDVRAGLLATAADRAIDPARGWD